MAKYLLDEATDDDDESGVLEEARRDPLGIFRSRWRDSDAPAPRDAAIDLAQASDRPDLSGNVCAGCKGFNRCPTCQKCLECFSCRCDEGL